VESESPTLQKRGWGTHGIKSQFQLPQARAAGAWRDICLLRPVYFSALPRKSFAYLALRRNPVNISLVSSKSVLFSGSMP